MEIAFIVLFILGVIHTALSIVRGLRKRYARWKIVDDALQASFVSVFSLVFIFPSGVAGSVALVASGLIVFRGIWTAVLSGSR